MQNQPGRRRRGWIIAGVVVLLLAAGGFFFFRNRQAPTAADNAENEINTAIAFIGDLSGSATASGQVEASRAASLGVSSSGKVTQVHVRVGDTVAEGDVLIRLETDNLELSVAQAEQSLLIAHANLMSLQLEPYAADVVRAETAVASAQANLDDLLAGPSVADMALYEANLRSAEASLASASAQLQNVRNSVAQSDVLAAQSALISAQIRQENAQEVNEDFANEATHDALVAANQALAAAQASYDALVAGPAAGELGAAQASLGAASARLDSSEANFALNTRAATEVQIAQAQQQLAQAQASLANLQEGPTSEEITKAEAEIKQAELSLADAQESLAKATVVSPFAGIITAVHVSEGELASGIVVELIDTSSFEVILSVDEVDIGQISIGQVADLTLETWPDETLASTVTAVAPSASEDSSGLITYDVHLGLGEVDLPILLGMTANASLVTFETDGILLVPNAAITEDRNAGIYSVNIITGEVEGIPQTETVNVAIGQRDSEYTQIIDGLSEGDEVLIGELEISEGGFGPFGRN